jgi:hypothetical protein
MSLQLAPNAKFAVTNVPAATTTATTNGAVIDTAGYNRCVVIVSAGAISSAGTIDVKVQEDDAVGFASPADISGAAITQLGDTDDNKVVVGEINLSERQQFLRAVITRDGVANSACAVLVVLYSSNDHHPVTTSSSAAPLDFNV